MRLEACATTPGSCSIEDRPQGLEDARQAPYQLSYSPSPCGFFLNGGEGRSMIWMTDTFQTNALQEAYMGLCCEHPRPCNVASAHTSSLSIATQWCSCSYAPCPRDKRPWRSQCAQETEQSLPEQSFRKAFSLSLPPFPRFFVSIRWSIFFFSKKDV